MVRELYIGLMSGTSMDAIDAALVDFSHDDIQLVSTSSISLPETMRHTLLALGSSGADEIEQMGRIDRSLAQLFAEAALATLSGTRYTAKDVRAIGSHGQTIRHRPTGEHPFTLQIADPNTIAECTSITVIADFRRRDIAAGGEGAPLVPAFHAGVFADEHAHRIVLNLGGIANITVLPAGQRDRTYGFDTGPANMLMDAWIQHQQNCTMDIDGAWAAAGTIHHPLLDALIAHPFFTKPFPKSTGREDFNLNWLQQILANFPVAIEAVDVQATLLELTARSVCHAISSTTLSGGDLFICGGGAFNQTLWKRLAQLLPQWRLRNTDEIGIAPTWVEAVAFAWLAKQTLNGLSGNLPMVTGAKGFRVLGGIFHA